MGLLEAAIRGHFTDEKVGRVVVFARDGRDRRYLVHSGLEEAKIISFLRMFYFAEYSILLLGSSLAFAFRYSSRISSLSAGLSRILSEPWAFILGSILSSLVSRIGCCEDPTRSHSRVLSWPNTRSQCPEGPSAGKLGSHMPLRLSRWRF
jgi:hypothetical protein